MAAPAERSIEQGGDVTQSTDWANPPRQRWFGKPLLVIVVAAVIGGVAGAAFGANNHDEHRRHTPTVYIVVEIVGFIVSMTLILPRRPTPSVEWRHMTSSGDYLLATRPEMSPLDGPGREREGLVQVGRGAGAQSVHLRLSP